MKPEITDAMVETFARAIFGSENGDFREIAFLRSGIEAVAPKIAAGALRAAADNVAWTGETYTSTQVAFRLLDLAAAIEAGEHDG